MVRVEASISCLAQRVGPRGSATSIISRMSDPVNRVMSPGSCVLVSDEGVVLKVTGLRAEVRVVGSVTAAAGGAAWTSVVMMTGTGPGSCSLGLRVGTVGEGSAAMPPVSIDVDTALLGLLESSPLVSVDVEMLGIDMKGPLPEKKAAYNM